MSIIKMLDLPVLGDSRGSLIALEENKNIPFSVKRIYYIFNTSLGVARGFHAHRNLKQLLICVAGHCKVILDDGEVREEVLLDSPTKALLVESMVWREMHDFSPGCVLLVLASDYYDELDYIRDYERFLAQSKLELVEYTEVFLELSWRWLNIPLIKEMTMTPDFSRAQQADFFSRIGPSHGNYVFGIAQNKKNIGACGVKNISGGSGELWLYIGEKEYWGLGLGRVIITKLEEIARLAGLSRLYLKVSSKNESAINLYLRAGYLIKSEACAGLINMEKML